jgi:hypothetical protein
LKFEISKGKTEPTKQQLREREVDGPSAAKAAIILDRYRHG